LAIALVADAGVAPTALAETQIQSATRCERTIGQRPTPQKFGDENTRQLSLFSRELFSRPLSVLGPSPSVDEPRKQVDVGWESRSLDSAMGDLKYVAVRVAHHGSPVAVWSIEWWFHARRALAVIAR
jgi:hypothetical protein